MRLAAKQQQSSRISVLEMGRRLDIGRLAVFAILEHWIMARTRLGPPWIIPRYACAQWERTCGVRTGAGFFATSDD